MCVPPAELSFPFSLLSGLMVRDSMELAGSSQRASEGEAAQAQRQQEGRAGTCCENEEFIGTKQRYTAGREARGASHRELMCPKRRTLFGFQVVYWKQGTLLSHPVPRHYQRKVLPSPGNLSPQNSHPSCSWLQPSIPPRDTSTASTKISFPPPPKKCEERAGLPRNCYCSV